MTGLSFGHGESASRDSDAHQQQPSVPSRDFSAPAMVVFLSPQIPEFGGSDKENVTLWSQRVDSVARIHQATDGVVHLAASGKLVGAAKRWYDLQMGAVLESWPALKRELIRMFKRRVSFYVAMCEVESRGWLSNKETFRQYALDKLALMHPLGLHVADQINLLIGGITNPTVRAIALSLGVTTMEQFMDVMRPIAEGVVELERKAPPAHKGGPSQEVICRNCGKKGHVHRICRHSDVTCFYCKAKGHRSFECPKLNRGRSGSAAAGAAAMSGPRAYGEFSTAGRTVAVVDGVSDKLHVENVLVHVVRLNNVDCDLSALIDTGSPISFIRFDIYNVFFKDRCERLEPAGEMYTTINDSRVQILGKLRMKFVLRELPTRPLEIYFHVIPPGGFRGDLILGRDLINEERLTIVFRPGNDTRDNNVSMDVAPFVLFHDDIFEPNRLEETVYAAEIDFDEATRRRLVDVMVDAQQSAEPVAADDYYVTLRIKDESTFACAPRRLAFAERRQMREITDDLLKRGIIKESTSPYCSRVVSVRKKNGTMRLCVDLRPLNARVHKQKYPFLLIEDCLARLGNKSVFTLLDLKDGFH